MLIIFITIIVVSEDTDTKGIKNRKTVKLLLLTGDNIISKSLKTPPKSL